MPMEQGRNQKTSKEVCTKGSVDILQILQHALQMW